MLFSLVNPSEIHLFILDQDMNDLHENISNHFRDMFAYAEKILSKVMFNVRAA